MNYYDELLANIDKLISESKDEEALSIIQNELNLPYVPREIEEKLNKYLSKINVAKTGLKSLTDDEIIEYLSSGYEHQLLAIDALNKKNLRDFIDVCENYLKGDGFINAKALLIDSLIRQEIDCVFTYVNNGSFIEFNPAKLNPEDETEDFIKCRDILQDYYMKDPSKYQLGLQLLYKEALLSLPNTINSDIVSEKIIAYIDDAFSAK